MQLCFEQANFCFDSDTKRDSSRDFRLNSKQWCLGQRTVAVIPTQRDKSWDVRLNSKRLCLEQRTVASIPTQKGQFMRLSFTLEAVVSRATNCCFDSDTKDNSWDFRSNSKQLCSGHELLLWFRHKGTIHETFVQTRKQLCLGQRTVALIPTQRDNSWDFRLNSKQLCLEQRTVALIPTQRDKSMRLSFKLEAVVSRTTNCCFDSDTKGQFMRLSFETRSSCVSGNELLLWFRHTGTIHETFV